MIRRLNPSSSVSAQGLFSEEGTLNNQFGTEEYVFKLETFTYMDVTILNQKFYFAKQLGTPCTTIDNVVECSGRALAK